jgi:hypothetical protein
LPGHPNVRMKPSKKWTDGFSICSVGRLYMYDLKSDYTMSLVTACHLWAYHIMVLTGDYDQKETIYINDSHGSFWIFSHAYTYGHCVTFWGVLHEGEGSCMIL